MFRRSRLGTWLLTAIVVVNLVIGFIFGGMGEAPKSFEVERARENQQPVVKIMDDHPVIETVNVDGKMISIENPRGGVLPGANGFTPKPSPKPLSGQNRPSTSSGLFSGSTSKGGSSGANKPPRASSGFRPSGKPVKKQGSSGGPSDLGGSGSGYPGDNSGSNSIESVFTAKSSDQSHNPDYSIQSQKNNRPSKQNKKKGNTHKISKKRVLQAYQDFLAKMKTKGYTTHISEDRFLELCINPQTNCFDEKSLFETTGDLQFELSGQIKNLRRPNNPAVDLDFVAEWTSSDKTIYIDLKRMIDFQSLANKGINISGFPSHESVAFNMGKESINQKDMFVGLNKGPTSREDVLHLFNFEAIQNRAEVPVLVQAVLNGAEQQGYTNNLMFLNYD